MTAIIVIYVSFTHDITDIQSAAETYYLTGRKRMNHWFLS